MANILFGGDVPAVAYAGPRTFTIHQTPLWPRWVRTLNEVKPLTLIYPRRVLPFLYGSAGTGASVGGNTRPVSGQVWPRGSGS